ncbi:hypothetical protein, partial [Vibrio crassostreae]|uniref:hypothetical protein n=1 Tax=Vibrio crassostreae TaxID=246167 RepID=UPI001C0F95F1
LKGKLNEFRQNPSVVNVMTKSLGSYDTTELLGDHMNELQRLTRSWTNVSYERSDKLHFHITSSIATIRVAIM